MKRSTAFASLLVILFGVVQGAFDLDGNIGAIELREVATNADSLIPFGARGVAFSQSTTDDCDESTTLPRSTSSGGIATVPTSTELYTRTSPVPSSSTPGTASLTTSWGPYIYSLLSTTSTSHGPVSIISSELYTYHTASRSAESCSEASTLASSSIAQGVPTHSSSASRSVETSSLSSASSESQAFGPSSTESCSETSSVISVSSPTDRVHTTRSSRKHSRSRSSTTHPSKPTTQTSSTSTAQTAITSSSLANYPGTSTPVISSTQSVLTVASSTENCTESSNSPATSSTAGGVGTSSSSLDSYPQSATPFISSTQSIPIIPSSAENCTENCISPSTVSTAQATATSPGSLTSYPVSSTSSTSTSQGIGISLVSTESCNETSFLAFLTSQSLASVSTTSSAVTLYPTVTLTAQSLPTVLSGVTYTYSTTTVQSTVTSTAQGVVSSLTPSESCSETLKVHSSEYQTSTPSSTSANAGEFTVLSSQSSPVALVNVSSIPRSTASDVISLTTPNILVSEGVGHAPLADETDVASTTTKNILSTSTVLSSSTVLVLTTVTISPSPPQTVAALVTPSPAEMLSEEVTVGITSTFTSMSTVVELTTIILTPQNSIAFTESQPQGLSTAASQVPSLTSSPPTIFTAGPICNGNNCLNELNRFNASAIPFCLTYTTTINTNPAAIPSYLENCNLSTQAVSSACTCMMYSSSQSLTAFLSTASPSTTTREALKNASPTLTETIIVSTPAGIVVLNDASSSPQGPPSVTLPGAAASPLGSAPTLSSYTASFSTYNTDTTLQTFLTPGAKPPVTYTTPESANTVSLSTTAFGPSPSSDTSGGNGIVPPTPILPWIGSGQIPPPVGTAPPLVITPLGNITTSGSQGISTGGVKFFILFVGFFTWAMLA